MDADELSHSERIRLIEYMVIANLEDNGLQWPSYEDLTSEQAQMWMNRIDGLLDGMAELGLTITRTLTEAGR